MSSSTRYPGIAGWFVATALGTSVVVASSIGPVGRLTWVSPIALFWIVTIAASLCVVTAAWVLVVAHRDDVAEVGMLGSALLVVSVLPLVHGLTAPGVLYGANSAVAASVFLALPLAGATASPLLADGSRWATALGRHWRTWSMASAVVTVVLASSLLIWPQAVTVPSRGHPVTVAVTIGSFASMLALSLRQLRLYWIGHRRATLLSAYAFLLLGLTALVWVGDRPFSVGWWLVHAVDITGVFLGCFALATGHRLRAGMADVLGPLLKRDPLVAFEFGLSPIVHELVAALDRKDPITRDHVIRVAELSLRVGEHMGLTPADLRDLALGALLHDIGKLVVPDEILHKPSRLTDAEYGVVQRHTVDGHALVRAEPGLAAAAAIVRSHHERVDGAGYPDGLRGDSVPIGARIVSACDAFDAMINTRQYRVGMEAEKVFAILREHAGSQWDARVVEHVIALAEPSRRDCPAALDSVGRHRSATGDDGCECIDALPVAVRDDIRLAASPT